MNRVLVTGGAGTIGGAVVRRLLRDPAFEVRVSDQRRAPQWMREGCEIHEGDLRQTGEARRAMQGCSHVIHLAALVGGIGTAHALPHTLLEVNSALSATVIRAALDQAAERFVYVSSAAVFERATEFPPTERHLADVPVPHSAYGFSKLAGEVQVTAARDEHGLPSTICRPFSAYGPGERPEDEPGVAHVIPDLIKKCLEIEHAGGGRLPVFGDGTQTRTFTHVDDIADGIVTAMASPAGLHEDFNIAAGQETSIDELARIVWTACGLDAGALEIEHLPAYELDVQRSFPSVAKAKDLLGWEAGIGIEEGVARTVAWLRDALPAAA